MFWNPRSESPEDLLIKINRALKYRDKIVLERSHEMISIRGLSLDTAYDEGYRDALRKVRHRWSDRVRRKR